MRIIKAFLFSVLGCVALANAACAEQSTPTYVAGEHFRVLDNPVQVQNPKTIEIAEFFSYTCSHCFAFESASLPWKKKLPADVTFVYSPAMWNGSMEVMAQAFYTAQTLGVLEDVHQALFNTIHLDRKMPRGAEDIAEIFAKFGVDKEATIKAFDSFGVKSAVKLADSRFRGANASGTPSLLVNGKYVIEVVENKVNHEDLMKIADYVVAQIKAGAM